MSASLLICKTFDFNKVTRLEKGSGYIFISKAKILKKYFKCFKACRVASYHKGRGCVSLELQNIPALGPIFLAYSKNISMS